MTHWLSTANERLPSLDNLIILLNKISRLEDPRTKQRFDADEVDNILLRLFDRQPKQIADDPDTQRVVRRYTTESVDWIRFIPQYEDASWEPIISDIENGVEFFEKVIVDGLTIDACSRDLNTDRDALCGAFRRALWSNTIQIYSVKRDTALERSLYEIYKKQLKPEQTIVIRLPEVKASESDKSQTDMANELMNVRVINTELVAQVAAHIAITKYDVGNRVAVGSGYTLERMCAHVVSRRTGFEITWLPMQAFSNSAYINDSRSANGIATILQSVYINSKAKFLPFITETERGIGQTDQLTSEQRKRMFEAGDIFAGIGGAGTVILSVGALKQSATDQPRFPSSDGEKYSFPQLEKLIRWLKINEPREFDKFAASILGYFIDENGERIGSKAFQDMCDKEFYAIGLDTLEEMAQQDSACRVWCVAGGIHKAKAVHAAINGGYVNCLVVDANIAQELVNDS